MHEPWAVAIAGRIHALWGADASVVASDDGIVARIPDTDGKLPDAAIFLFEPEKLLQIVREAVGSSALFAARFRECAARALLMPGRTPGHRTRFGNNGCAPVSCWKSLRDIRIFRSFSKPYANVCKMFMIFPHWNV